MKIALAQLAVSDDTVANIEAITSVIRSAENADVVVFPEAAMNMPADLGGVAAVAEPLDGPFVSAVRTAAAAAGVGVVAGMWEAADGVYNTIVVVDSGGALVASYRKAHLYDAFAYRESDHVCASSEPVAVTFAGPGLTLGVATCYDLRFPETARALVDVGADVLVFPSAWVPGPLKEDHWVTLVRARAIENTAYVVAVNQAPPQGTGRSIVVDPAGVIVGELGEQPGVRVLELVPARIAAVRETNPSLRNRRYSVVPRT